MSQYDAVRPNMVQKVLPSMGQYDPIWSLTRLSRACITHATALHPVPHNLQYVYIVINLHISHISYKLSLLSFRERFPIEFLFSIVLIFLAQFSLEFFRFINYL